MEGMDGKGKINVWGKFCANIHQRLALTADITETKGVLATVEYKVELKKV